MSAIATASIVFVCVFGGAMLGLILRAALPQHHLSSDTKDVVKLGMGLVGTMTALLLGLLVASAKSSYDTEKSGLIQMSAKVIFLDRLLAAYGPEAHEARSTLRGSFARAIARIWPRERSGTAQLDPSASGAEGLLTQLQMLSPQNDMQRLTRTQALSVIMEIGQMRWLIFEQAAGTSISKPFLVVVVFWLAVIFLSFGLFAPGNATVITTLLICALSVSGAVFLVLELDHPFDGLIRISSEPMRQALDHLGK
jgi:hypothetical protein